MAAGYRDTGRGAGRGPEIPGTCDAPQDHPANWLPSQRRVRQVPPLVAPHGVTQARIHLARAGHWPRDAGNLRGKN